MFAKRRRWICSWCILLYYKRKLTVSSFTLYSDDITVQLLVLLVCMENLSKNSLLQRSQGVSLSIADAKVVQNSHSNQTLGQLFSKKIYMKLLSVWFTLLEELADFYVIFTKWHAEITKQPYNNITKAITSMAASVISSCCFWLQ